MSNDGPIPQNEKPPRRRKLFLRVYPFSLPPERDDCDQGAYFDEIDELLEEWVEDGSE